VAWKEGRYTQKASDQVFRIADLGFRIFLLSFFNPHSAICNPQFRGPIQWKNNCLRMMIQIPPA
jgi:hypothetical protein